MAVHIGAADTGAVLSAARAALEAHLSGERLDEDLDFDADYGLWSLSAGEDGLRLELVVFGFPVSGFSGLRRFFLRLGASEVRQRPTTSGR